MSTIKKRVPPFRAKKSDLSGNELYELVFGCAIFKKTEFDSEKSKKEKYFRFKKEIFARQGQESSAKSAAFEWGERPAGWWQFDSECPEDPRRQIGGDTITPMTTALFFGIPTRWDYRIRKPVYKHKLPVWESQYDYLRRHGLITQQEKDQYYHQEARKEREKDKFQKKMIGKNDI